MKYVRLPSNYGSMGSYHGILTVKLNMHHISTKFVSVCSAMIRKRITLTQSGTAYHVRVGGSNGMPVEPQAFVQLRSYCVVKSHIVQEVTLFLQNSMDLDQEVAKHSWWRAAAPILAWGQRQQQSIRPIAEHHVVELKDSGTAVNCEGDRTLQLR